MPLVEELMLVRNNSMRGGPVPYAVTPHRIDALIGCLPLKAKKPNSPEVVKARMAEVYERLLLIAQMIEIRKGPEPFVEQLEYLAKNVLKKHGIDIMYGRGNNLEAKLAEFSPPQMDSIEALQRFTRKVANYAFDYMPDGVDVAVREMCGFIAPLPLSELTSTAERERYPLGKKVTLFYAPGRGEQSAFVLKMGFDELTLLDRLGVVIRQARLIDELVTGKRSDGALFKALATEIAPKGKAVWEAFQRQATQSRWGLNAYTKAAGEYARAFAQLMAQMNAAVEQYASSGSLGINQMVEKAESLFPALQTLK